MKRVFKAVKMKNKIALKTAFVFALLCAIVIVFAILLAGRVARADSDDSPAYAYSNSSVVIDVNENKVLHIKENLKVGFVKAGRSGITRRISAKMPSYKNRGGRLVKNGSFLSRLSNVSAKVNGEEAETNFNKNGVCYYLSITNPKGDCVVWEYGHDERQYDFTLEYDYDLSDDEAGKSAFALTFFDEVEPLYFYFGEDKSNIARLDVTVNMPKPFDGGGARVIYDGKDATQAAALKTDGNSLNFSIQMKNISKNSLRMALNGDYFDTQVTKFSYYWYFAGFVGIIILICLIITFINHGKKPVCPVEAEPPVVNPLHYSAYWHGYPQRKDVTTIILYWARLGCLKITKDGKKDLILTRLKPLPETCTIAEKRYFNELFRYGDVFRSKDTRGFANRNRRDFIRFRVNELVEESERPTPFAPEAERAKMFINILSVIGVGAVYAYFILLSLDVIWLAVVPMFLFITLVPIVKLHSVFYGMRNLKQKSNSRFYFILFGMLSLFVPLGLFAWFLFSTQYMGQYDYIHITFISLAWVVISFFVLPKFIKKRTEEANALYGRMLGFKRFIRLADLPKMELLLKDNPDYFYDVLPYCMVMGLSDKIDKQMQYLGVASPDWADGFDPANFAKELFYSVKHAIIVKKKKRSRNSYALDD